MKFTAKETLNRHLKTHTGKKSYKCEECGVSFIQRTQLKNHMFHHTGEDGHECPHCEEQFDNKASMTRHISSQHNLGEKCATCGAVFGCQQDLQNHEEAMHSTNKSGFDVSSATVTLIDCFLFHFQDLFARTVVCSSRRSPSCWNMWRSVVAGIK